MIEKAWLETYDLIFREPAKTSRDVLRKRRSYFIFLEDENGVRGLGEAAPIFGLSVETEELMESKLSEVIYLLNHRKTIDELNLTGFPSIRFALESAWNNLQTGGKAVLFQTPFTEGKTSITTNGLIWMNSTNNMLDQVRQKVEAGFHCIKLKIGALKFEDEVDLLKKIRLEFGQQIELRLDANGAFSPAEALKKLNVLADFDIHSIEQPIAANQPEKMAEICNNSPINIALDEELIGVPESQITTLLSKIKPNYIILKPSLLGGLTLSNMWINSATELGIDWWVTSALESNVGLNVIAQWFSTKKSTLPQGLGTGQLFTNNFSSPLELMGENMFFRTDQNWDLSVIEK